MPCSASFRLTWKLPPGLPSHAELWVVMTVAGFAFVDLDGFTPVQGWNSCLEHRARSPPCAGPAIPAPDPTEAAALVPCCLKCSWPHVLLKSCVSSRHSLLSLHN